MARQPEPVRPAADAGREIHLRPLTVGFIGSGRAASAVARGLHRAGHALLVGRRGDTAVGLADAVDAKLLDPGELLATADVTFLAVPDAAIAGLARDLAEMSPPGDGRLVAHFAGSVGRSALAPLEGRGFRTAAIHPLQVLSGWRIAAGTGFAVESDPAAAVLVGRLVADLGGTEFAIAPSSRPAYHAAAVIAANLGMTMLAEAVDLMEQQGIPRDEALQGLGALVRGGLEASMDTGLPGAITGPVGRGDVGTVEAHLAALEGDPGLRRAYAATSLLTLRQVARDGRPADLAASAALRQLLEAAL